MNTTTLSGTLTSAPEQRQTPRGPVTSFRISFRTERPTVGRGFVAVLAYDELATVAATLRKAARRPRRRARLRGVGRPRPRRSRNTVVAAELYHVGQAPAAPEDRA